MNKEEIEQKLVRARTAETTIKNEIIELLEQLVESEKPKLRHGDFGYFHDFNDTPRLIVKDKIYHDEGICGNINYDTCYTILGNIFDLLKEWSEDLVDFTVTCNRSNREVYAQIEDNEISLQMGGDEGRWCWANLSEAEEIWHKLGQLIATLKRKLAK